MSRGLCGEGDPKIGDEAKYAERKRIINYLRDYSLWSDDSVLTLLNFLDSNGSPEAPQFREDEYCQVISKLQSEREGLKAAFKQLNECYVDLQAKSAGFERRFLELKDALNIIANRADSDCIEKVVEGCKCLRCIARRALGVDRG